LHRELEDPNKWKSYLFEIGYAFSVLFVIVWYFFIKRKIIISSLFLPVAFCIYLYIYKLFALYHDRLYLLRIPLFVLLTAVVAHFFVNRRYFYPFASMLKNRLIENRFLNSSFFVFVCGGLLGALFFIYIFGTAILDFTYTDWLMFDFLGHADLSIHYFGWKLFRNSSWYFQLGLIDNIVYPFKVSIIYTDSVPLFAIIFKILSPLLPENFQYFGLFGIVNYTLQGGIGALIIRKIGGNTCQSIISSLFFTLSTVMMFRIYGHTSLSAHFIILLCILAYLQNNNFNLKKQVIIWSSLLALSVSIHMYFVPMVMIFMFFRLLQEYILSKNIKNQCIVFSASVFILLGTMLCLGAFYFIEDVNTAGLGFYSVNLNGFVNPQGISRFLKDMPVATTPGQVWEGNAYLGLGIILFIVTVIFQLYQKKKNDLPIVKKEKMLPVLGIVLSFLVFSLSPVITFNQYKLFTYPVLSPVERLWSIFRATGRMTWPIIYIIMTACIWWAIKQFSVKKSVLFLCVLLLIQWADLKPWFVSKGNQFKTKLTWQSELSSPIWDNLASDYKHIFFMGDCTFMGDYKKLFSFLDLTGNYKLTVNDSYLARKNERKINENKQKEALYLLENGPRNDMVYIFKDEEQAFLFKETGINVFIVDDVVIGIDSKKTYLDNYRF